MVTSKKSSLAKFTSIIALFFEMSLWSGCGGGMAVGNSTSAAAGMKIAPSSTTLRAGDSVQFSATVTGNMNQVVAWSVNGVAGGNSSVGTIDSTGPTQPSHAEFCEGPGDQLGRQISFSQQFCKPAIPSSCAPECDVYGASSG